MAIARSGLEPMLGGQDAWETYREQLIDLAVQWIVRADERWPGIWDGRDICEIVLSDEHAVTEATTYARAARDLLDQLQVLDEYGFRTTGDVAQLAADRICAAIRESRWRRGMGG